MNFRPSGFCVVVSEIPAIDHAVSIESAVDATTFLHPLETGGVAQAAIACALTPEASSAGEAFAAQWLHGEEHDRYRRFRVDRARQEFLAGRMAAKTALHRLVPGSPVFDWEIVRGQWHRPCVRGPVAGFAVTLAHAAGLAIAVAFDDRWRCGIDLEALERDADDVIAREVDPHEVAWSRAAPAERRMRSLVLWTAREALGKFLGSGLLLPHMLRPTRNWTQVAHGWSAAFAETDLITLRSVVAPRHVASLVAPGGTDLDVPAGWLHHALTSNASAER